MYKFLSHMRIDSRMCESNPFRSNKNSVTSHLSVALLGLVCGYTGSNFRSRKLIEGYIVNLVLGGCGHEELAVEVARDIAFYTL